MSFKKFLQEEQPTPQQDLIQVPGIGILGKDQVELRIKQMLTDLAKRASSPTVDWRQIRALLNHSALHAYVDVLNTLQE